MSKTGNKKQKKTQGSNIYLLIRYLHNGLNISDRLTYTLKLRLKFPTCVTLTKM